MAQEIIDTRVVCELSLFFCQTKQFCCSFGSSLCTNANNNSFPHLTCSVSRGGAADSIDWNTQCEFAILINTSDNSSLKERLTLPKITVRDEVHQIVISGLKLLWPEVLIRFSGTL